MNIPFTNNKGGNTKSFKILNNDEIDSNMKKHTFVNFIKKMLYNEKKNNKIYYMKATESKDYYNKLKK
jgi:hypothetical protein